MVLTNIDVAETVTSEVTNQLNFFQKLVYQIENNALEFVLKLFFAILVLIIGLIIIYIIRKLNHKWLTKLSISRLAKKGNPIPVHFIEEIIKFVSYIILFVIIAQVFGVSTASIIAVLGSSLLAVGLGFQGALSNFAGGFLLLFTKPFNVGDYIIIGNGLGEGTVSKIGVVYTTLKVGDLRDVIIPNGTLADNTIINMTPNSLRFVELTFPIAYSSDLQKAKDIVSKIATEDADTVKEKNISVYVASLDSDSVNIGLRFFVKPAAYPQANWRITETVKLTFDKEGISIPFRQMDVYVKEKV